MYGPGILIHTYGIYTYGHYLLMGSTGHAGRCNGWSIGHGSIYSHRYTDADDSQSADSYIYSVTDYGRLYSRCDICRNDDGQSKSNDSYTGHNHLYDHSILIYTYGHYTYRYYICMGSTYRGQHNRWSSGYSRPDQPEWHADQYNSSSSYSYL
jgi:hypothetical protein